MKKLLMLLFLLLPSVAQAQSTKAALTTEINTNLASGQPGGITASTTRTTLIDILNSIMPTAPVIGGNLACFDGATGLLKDCGTVSDVILSGAQNLVWATPNGVAGTATFRGITNNDFPVVSPAKGGNGLDNSAAVTNDVLAWTGSGFLHTALLTVLNTVCTATPVTCSNFFGFMKPEWYGATPSPYPTAAGSIANNQTQIQNAINAVAANGGGTILFTGVYGVGTGITAGSNIILKGVGIHNSTLLFQPTANGQAGVTFTAGTGIVSNCGFYNLSIGTADTTFSSKIGLSLRDVSRCNADNFMISAYPTGNWTGPGASGDGLITLGRELTNVSNFQIYADNPIVFFNNPNVAGGTEDLDSWHFWNNNLVAPLTGATTHVITVGAGVVPFNLHMDGYQDWGGGVDGFNMVGTTSSAAFGIYISGIKDEQAGATGGYSIHITPSGGVYGLHVADSLIGARNAVFLQNTKQAYLSSITYDANTSTTKVGLNADISNTSITFSGNSWITGTTATLGAFTNSNWITPTGFSTALPASGVSWH